MFVWKQCWKFTNGSQRIELSRSGTFSSRRAAQFHLVLSLAWQNGTFQALLRLESTPWPCMKEGACACLLFTDRLPKPPNSVTALSSLLSLSPGAISQPHTSPFLSVVFQTHSFRHTVALSLATHVTNFTSFLQWTPDLHWVVPLFLSTAPGPFMA